LLNRIRALVRLPSFINVFAAAGNKAISEYEKALGVKTHEDIDGSNEKPTKCG